MARGGIGLAMEWPGITHALVDRIRFGFRKKWRHNRNFAKLG